MSARRKRKVAKKKRPAARRRREPAWTRLSDTELLRLRFCDLRLSLRGTMVERRWKKVLKELASRGIRFKPHLWLSEEWFSPDGVPGIAVPFYMAHPRLMRLERLIMGEVEGGNVNWLTRILRHETGHALDNAFRLRRRKGWRKTFGRSTEPYPDVYKPRPASRNFVLHLGHWYAQSHPSEDFAETFAVWMQPRARWRREYQGWPALKKLEYVDTLMGSLKGAKPVVQNKDMIEPLSEDTRTLAEHYAQKRDRYDIDGPGEHDLRLKRIFGKRSRRRRHLSASTFVRRVRPQLERLLVRRSRLHPYLIHHVMRTIIQRCRELDLVLDTSQRDAKRAVLGVVERILMDMLRHGRETYAL